MAGLNEGAAAEAAAGRDDAAQVPSLFERRRGTLLGTFVGDTLGLPHETTKTTLAGFDRLEVVSSHRHGAGAYSDDTEMAVAIAEELAEHGTIERNSLARRFAAALTPERGYGTKTKTLLALVAAGADLADAQNSVYGAAHGSTRNGASMRVAPVGAHYAFAAGQLRLQVWESCCASGHSLELAIAGAQAQAAAVAAAVRGEDAAEIVAAAREASGSREFYTAFDKVADLLTATPSSAAVVEALGNGIEALTSVPAAIWAAAGADSFEQTAERAIALGGDADTIGAMACAIAGGRFGADTIPARWLDKLDNGPRGIDFVESLCRRLWA